MTRSFILTILKFFGEVLLISLVVGGIVLLLGHQRQWDTAMKYSNAFFIAGALLIIAGASSRMTAGEDFTSLRRLSGDSFRGMNSSQLAHFIIEVSSPLRLVILGIASGILLIILSQIVAYGF